MALARQWMKFIVVTQGFKAIGLMRPNQLAKPKEPQQSLGDTVVGLDNGATLQSDTSADGAEFEFDAGGNVQLVTRSCYYFDSNLTNQVAKNRLPSVTTVKPSQSSIVWYQLLAERREG